MAWKYIDYSYPVPYNFEKFLVWSDTDYHCYFALKEKTEDSWVYYSGDGGYDLASDYTLTERATEVDAQTNYLDTTGWTFPVNGGAARKLLAILPTLIQAKYVRLYVDDSDNFTIHEFKPSTQLIADEIVTGSLEIRDDFGSPPILKVIVSDSERIRIGQLETDNYGIRGWDDSANLLFELGSDTNLPYLKNYADNRAIELELMKINFQYISWAQFAVFDNFDDETKRVNPDPSAHDARVYKSWLDNGTDDTPDRSFGFVSKSYSNITTIETGASTDVGLNYLEDTSKNWFTDECKNLTLHDSLDATFNVISNTGDTLTISGTPTAGNYSLIDDNPQYSIAFCSYLDSTGGGTGYVKLEVSFDNGANYQTFLDTFNSIDLLGATVAIANVGNDYIVRLTLTNDGSGYGPLIYNFLVGTDPSPWRF